MSSGRYIQRAAEQDRTLQRLEHEHQDAFQAVPGESEADAVREAFLHGASTPPAVMPALLAQTGAETRAQALSRLQRSLGNSVVQRLVGESGSTHGALVGASQDEMVGEVLQRKGSGSPLPDQTRDQMEGFFGADLSGVRIHTDAEAAALNNELSSQAFTVGNDVFLGEGKYSPSTTDGQALLAHEITHVGQQGGFTGGSTVQRLEEEAAVQREGEMEEDEELPPS